MENVRRSCASLPLAIQLAARLLTTAGATASHYATREVVGDEGAHEAVMVADLVLRPVRLHHGEIDIGALDRLVGRTVYHRMKRMKRISYGILSVYLCWTLGTR